MFGKMVTKKESVTSDTYTFIHIYIHTYIVKAYFAFTLKSFKTYKRIACNSLPLTMNCKYHVPLSLNTSSSTSSKNIDHLDLIFNVVIYNYYPQKHVGVI